jgi:hypothetical protein
MAPTTSASTSTEAELTRCTTARIGAKLATRESGLYDLPWPFLWWA